MKLTTATTNKLHNIYAVCVCVFCQQSHNNHNILCKIFKLQTMLSEAYFNHNLMFCVCVCRFVCWRAKVGRDSAQCGREGRRWVQERHIRLSSLLSSLEGGLGGDGTYQNCSGLIKNGTRRGGDDSRHSHILINVSQFFMKMNVLLSVFSLFFPVLWPFDYENETIRTNARNSNVCF